MKNISREENGLANQETSTADQGQKVYKVNGLEALETRPHHVSGARGDSGADASHRTVQAWMDSREKKVREGTEEPKNEKSNHCGKERTYSWLGEHSQLQANNEQSPFVSRPPRHCSLNKMAEALTIQTVLKDRKLSSHSSSGKPSRSLSQRRGRLDSKDRGRIFITVQ